ncbi:hypothetical protein ACHAWO_013916 [Cyclotella atomus]|uniref:Uncharacterized protein n=1 Tax=Cyclotella atomus TaxID=382360 RepID=A0ABD3PD26_9STRA
MPLLFTGGTNGGFCCIVYSPADSFASVADWNTTTANMSIIRSIYAADGFTNEDVIKFGFLCSNADKKMRSRAASSAAIAAALILLVLLVCVG